MASAVPRQLILLLLGRAVAAGGTADGFVLKAADGIEVKIEPSSNKLDYSVSVDGEKWLQSGPVAMPSGGVTYTSECTDTDSACLSLSATPTKSSGTDVSTLDERCMYISYHPRQR